MQRRRRPAAGTTATPRPPRSRAARRHAPRRAALLAAILVLLTALPAALAQTFSLTAGASGISPLIRLAASDVPRAGGTIGLAAGLFPAPGVDLEVRNARAVGALGTLTLEAAGGVRVAADLQARLRLGARGSFGPVAGRLEARAWSAPPERFDPLVDPGPARAAAGVSLRLTADGRVDRTWLLGGELRGEWGRGAGLVLDGRFRARARRVLAPELDLQGRAEVRLTGAGDGRVGFGVGVLHAPRRAPEIGAAAFLDLAPTAGGVRAAPGLDLHGARPVAGGRLAWKARLRPLSAERAPWYLETSWRRPLEVGALRIEGTLMHGGSAGTRATAALSYQRPLDLP